MIKELGIDKLNPAQEQALNEFSLSDFSEKEVSVRFRGGCKDKLEKACREKGWIIVCEGAITHTIRGRTYIWTLS